jgi:hypothetical protein
MAYTRMRIHPSRKRRACCVGYFRVSYLEKTLLTADQKA